MEVSAKKAPPFAFEFSASLAQRSRMWPRCRWKCFLGAMSRRWSGKFGDGVPGLLAPEFSSIEEYLGRNTREYYDVLLDVGAGNWNPRRDARSWVRFCLTAHFRQARTILRRSREVQQTWDALEVEVKKRKLPERTILALSDAASGLRVRNAAYRSVADISVQVATKDLKLLVDRGLLVSSGEKKWRSYEASDFLKDLRSCFRAPKRVADPFARIVQRVSAKRH
jgi:hypothetical protein